MPSICKRVDDWLHTNGIDTSPLTDTDWRALSAFMHILELWNMTARQNDALDAAACCVRTMQPHTRVIAKRAIPCALDWACEDELWPEIIARIEKRDASCL